MSNFKSIKDYFSNDKTFVVPYYQRGYKWSLQKNTKRGDLHLSLLLSDLKNEFENSLQQAIQESMFYNPSLSFEQLIGRMQELKARINNLPIVI